MGEIVEFIGVVEREISGSLSAINATKMVVNFSQAVDKTNAEGTAFTLTDLDSQGATTLTAGAGSLSADGKSLTLTANKVLSKRYQLSFSNVQLKDNSNIKVSYNETVTFAADTTAPTITGYEQTSATNVRIKFSEPVDALAATGIAFKDSEGNTIAKGSGAGLIPSATISKNDTYFDVNLSDIAADKKVTVTFNGLVDLAGNLVNPQPASIVIEKKTLATFTPSISAVTQTGAKTFKIKFSEDLDGTTLAAGNITLDNGFTLNGAINKLSASEYEVTTNQNLSGLVNVTVAHAGVVSAKGQTAPTTNLTKLVTFSADAVAAKATAKLATDKNNQQVIELTFDKDVVLIGDKEVAISGSYVKDFVTTPVSANVAAAYADSTGKNKKVVHISLASGTLDVEGAVYDLSLGNKTASTNGIASEADVDMSKASVSFTRGKDGVAPNSNTHVLAASDIVVAQGSDNNEVTVTFTKPSGTLLDGPTATNIANYTIAGAEVESASLAAQSNATTQVVTLKLKANSNTFTGVRNATVKNVKIAGSSKVMESVTKATTSLNENVLPTITNATITGAKQITLTFSESIASVKGDDFLVKAGTATLALGTTASAVIDSNDKKVVITLANALTGTELAETITVAPSATAANFEVKDTVNNVLAKFAPITVVKP